MAALVTNRKPDRSHFPQIGPLAFPLTGMRAPAARAMASARAETILPLKTTSEPAGRRAVVIQALPSSIPPAAWARKSRSSSDPARYNTLVLT